MKKILYFIMLALALTLTACGTKENADKPRESEGAKYTCSIEIRCDTILDNMDKLAEGKDELIPSDGLIIKIDSAEFTEGDSVFDVTQRELQSRRVHFDTFMPELMNLPILRASTIFMNLTAASFPAGSTA
jgi:hypothetical protein